MNDGRKKKSQKYKNKVAFKIKFDTKAIQTQKKVSLQLLCKRCKQQMEWKLKYNKYKKMTQPGKCLNCHLKIIIRSYMKLCDYCAQQKQICAKCLSVQQQLSQQAKINKKTKLQKQKDIQKQMNQFILSLRQRSRRTIKRNLQKGIITWDNQNKYFIDEKGIQLTNLYFRNNYNQQQQDNIDKEDNQSLQIIDQEQ